MNIRPIKTNADYEEALAEVKRLWNAAPGSAAADTLEVLAMLIHHHEREREPLPPLDPIEAIELRMEQQGLSRKDLLPMLGSTGRTSEVLSRKRPLTLNMIRKLHALLGIPLESLVQPSREPEPRQRSGRSPTPKPAQRRRRNAAA